MSVGDYAAGVTTLLVVAVCWGFAAVRACGRLLPGWAGAAARLVEVVLGVSGLVVASELLGAAGQFSRPALAAVSALAAVLAGLATARPSDAISRQLVTRAARYSTGAIVLAVAAGGGALALVVGASVGALHGGPVDTDSLHYHLTAAAHLVQSGNLADLHRMSAGDSSAFYPFNAELIDAVAMLGPRPDLATLVVNPLFTVMALLAAWVIGDRYQVAPAAAAVLCVVLATPLVVGASSGPGLNDIPATAFLLAAIAVLAHAARAGTVEPCAAEETARWPVGVLAFAGAALGLAAGTKLPLLAPVGLVAVGVAVAARAGRLRSLAALVVPAVITGGFWYVRDWVLVGSPLPGVDLHAVGLPGVPTPYITPYAYSTAHYLTDRSVLRHWYEPQLHVDFGVLWPLFVALPVAALVLACFRRLDPVLRIAAVTAVGGFVAYLVTPTTAIGPPGQPVLFGSNVRYAIPELALALVLLAIAPRGRSRITATCLVAAGLTAAYFFAAVGSSLRPVYRSEGALIVVVAGAVAAAAVLAVRRSGRPVVMTAAAGGLLVVVLALAGYPLQHHYLKERYAPSAAVPASAWAFTRGLHHARVALVGFPLQYPVYGDDLDNRVQYVAQPEPHHAYDDFTDCRSWGAALRSGGYDYAVVELTPNHDYRPFLQWTKGTVVAHTGGITVLRLDRGEPVSCR